MDSKRLELRAVIEKEVFVTKEHERVVAPDGTDTDWIFDFRRVILKADVLDVISELFWEACEELFPFQVGGIEVASIPLIAAFVLKLKEKRKVSNGFFIRKSRKKSGLLRMIEGTVTDEPNIVLVDDLINSGSSFIRQIEVLEALGKKVGAVFVILRFRDLSYYSYFHKRGIHIISLFELNDFRNSLDVKELVDKKEEPVPMPFRAQWYWKADKPNYFQVISKSAPVLDSEKIYFGTDNGSFWALNQGDGSVAWEYKTLLGFHKRKAFSAPALHDGVIYVGARDGNFYALDAATGKRKWVCMDADWIGSAPCLASRLGLVLVGLEFGLWNKRGSVVALEMSSGKKKWEFPMPGAALSAPAYSDEYATVVCGGDNTAYGLDVATGKQRWTFITDGELHGSFAVCEERGFVCFGSYDSFFYVLNIRTGELMHAIQTDAAIYASPSVYGQRAYIASLDKTLYCIDLNTGECTWKFPTKGRIFASPLIANDRVYIGSNDGRLYELDASTGKNTAFFQATERITDKPAYNSLTNTFFLPTFANEIYCLKRSGNE